MTPRLLLHNIADIFDSKMGYAAFQENILNIADIFDSKMGYAAFPENILNIRYIFLYSPGPPSPLPRDLNYVIKPAWGPT